MKQIEVKASHGSVNRRYHITISDEDGSSIYLHLRDKTKSLFFPSSNNNSNSNRQDERQQPPEQFRIQYKDEDGDLITVSSDEEVWMAITVQERIRPRTVEASDSGTPPVLYIIVTALPEPAPATTAARHTNLSPVLVASHSPTTYATNRLHHRHHHQHAQRGNGSRTVASSSSPPQQQQHHQHYNHSYNHNHHHQHHHHVRHQYNGNSDYLLANEQSSSGLMPPISSCPSPPSSSSSATSHSSSTTASDTATYTTATNYDISTEDVQSGIVTDENTCTTFMSATTTTSTVMTDNSVTGQQQQQPAFKFNYSYGAPSSRPLPNYVSQPNAYNYGVVGGSSMSMNRAASTATTTTSVHDASMGNHNLTNAVNSNSGSSSSSSSSSCCSGSGSNDFGTIGNNQPQQQQLNNSITPVSSGTSTATHNELMDDTMSVSSSESSNTRRNRKKKLAKKARIQAKKEEKERKKEQKRLELEEKEKLKQQKKDEKERMKEEKKREKEQKLLEKELIKSDDFDMMKPWPPDIKYLYLDGNNMFFVCRTFRVYSKRNKRVTERLLNAIALDLHNGLTNLRETHVCYDKTVNTVMLCEFDRLFRSTSAMPEFQSADDQLTAIAWQRQQIKLLNYCMFVTSDKDLRKRLKDIGAKVVSPGPWLKGVHRTMATLDKSVPSDFNTWTDSFVDRVDLSADRSESELEQVPPTSPVV